MLKNLIETTPASGTNSGGLSTGAIVGIAVGGAAALTITGVLFWLLRRNAQRKPGNMHDTFDGPSGE